MCVCVCERERERERQREREREREREFWRTKEGPSQLFTRVVIRAYI